MIDSIQVFQLVPRIKQAKSLKKNEALLANGKTYASEGIPPSELQKTDQQVSLIGIKHDIKYHHIHK